MSITVEINEQEIRLIQVSLYERQRAIKRKRSWRPSEQAAALVECKWLGEKLDRIQSAYKASEVSVTGATVETQKRISD